MGGVLPLFFLSACDTIRPNSVAAYAPAAIENATALGDDTDGKRMDHTAFASVLQQFVDSKGVVNYAAMAASPKRLQYYAFELGAIELGEYSRYEQLAILLNAYNAFTLQLLLEYPGVT